MARPSSPAASLTADGPPLRAVPQPRHGPPPLRADEDDRGQGQGNPPARGEDDHAGQEAATVHARRQASRSSTTRTRGEGVRRTRPALRQPARRLHAHHQARTAPGRRRPDGAARARGGGASKERSAPEGDAAESEWTGKLRRAGSPLLAGVRAGRRTAGSQYQENAPTVQGRWSGLSANLTGESIGWRWPGRTDAGVHARGPGGCVRHAHAGTAPETFARGTNALLPDDIAVRAARKSR